MLSKFNSSGLQKYLTVTLRDFDQMPALNQKEIVRRVIAKAIIRDDNRLELHLNIDPKNPKMHRPSLDSSKGRLIELAPFGDSKDVGNGEVNYSTLVRNGGPGRGRCKNRPPSENHNHFKHKDAPRSS